MKTKTKQIILLILIVALAIGATGCGTFSPEDHKKEEKPATTSQAAISEYKNGLGTMGGDFKFFVMVKPTVSKYKDLAGANSDDASRWTFLRDTANELFYIALNQHSTSYKNGWSEEPKMNLNLNPDQILTKTTGALRNATEDNAILSALQGIATSILIAIWAMGFLSQIINEKWSPETLLKTFMQLICGIVLIGAAPKIVGAFASLGTGLSPSAGSINATNEAAAAIDKAGDFILMLNLGLDLHGIGIHFALTSLWVDVGSIVVLLISAVLAALKFHMAFKIVSQMIFRHLELTARISVSPIVLALTAQTGFTQESIRYFRSTAATALQPMLIILGINMFPTIQTVLHTVIGASGIYAAVEYGAALLALSAYVGMTKQLSQDIIAR